MGDVMMKMMSNNKVPKQSNCDPDDDEEMDIWDHEDEDTDYNGEDEEYNDDDYDY